MQNSRPLLWALLGVALVSSCFIPLAAFATDPFDEEVFYPIPDNLVVNQQPIPTAELLARPGYGAADSDDEMTINAYVFLPDNYDPNEEYPTVMLLHGSGSLWSNRQMSNGISYQYREWADELNSRGYLVIMPDSYHLRGISGGFTGRRPHDNPDEDDALCSPNYERPKDVVATLEYLAGRPDVDVDNVGIVSFSQGAQTALNSILDPSVDLGDYAEDCLLADESDDYERDAPEPVRIPNNLPFPKIVVVYYPGCGFFGYHGQPSSTSAGRYMPDARTKVLMGHGTEDSLMDEGFPPVLVAASRAHAIVEGVSDPFVYHYQFIGADHSFDNYSVKIEDEADWWTDEESPDEYAKRIMRKETLRQFAYRLKGEPYLIVPKYITPGNVTLGIGGNENAPPGIEADFEAGKIYLSWRSEDGLGYQVNWMSNSGRKSNVLSRMLLDDGEGIEVSVPVRYFHSGDVEIVRLPGLAAWQDWRNLPFLRMDDSREYSR